MIPSLFTHVLRFLLSLGLRRIYTKQLSSFWGPLLSNLEVDPLFVDGPNGDLTLQAGSPLIGAGSDDSTIGDPRWDPTAVSVNDDSPVIMDGYSLRQNYPNPFNPVTEITFEVPVTGDISLKAFNMIGQEIALIASGNYSAGLHTVSFNGVDLSSGIYFYTLTGSGVTITKKMILMK
ncbi:MAG: T9SS type A sorting domain-containing protein [Candidatus Marinimicrobia bacterium]|nr:T9SS type A sorting domain-containing protein [Candidatus Neomarinimicrobiota bacterium]